MCGIAETPTREDVLEGIEVALDCVKSDSDALLIAALLDARYYIEGT